jgi:hypothetical protein
VEALAIALFLSVTIKTILDYIAEPLRTKFPNLDLWYFNWIALVLGGCVSWIAGINLFVTYIPNEFLGKLLTAMLIGGGSKLINDVFTNAPGRTMTETRGATNRESFEYGARASTPRPKGW